MEDYRIRVRIFIGLILFLFLVLSLRLFQLQFIDADAYAGESRMNSIGENRVQRAGDVVYDRAIRLRVDNEHSYAIALTPRHFRDENIPRVADPLEVPDSVVAARLEQAGRWSAFRPS